MITLRGRTCQAVLAIGSAVVLPNTPCVPLVIALAAAVESLNFQQQTSSRLLVADAARLLSAAREWVVQNVQLHQQTALQLAVASRLGDVRKTPLHYLVR